MYNSRAMNRAGFAKKLLLSAAALAGLFALGIKSPALRAQSNTFVLADLKSADWGKRADTYYTIKSSPDALERADVKTALIDPLDRENQLRNKTTKSKTWGGFDEDYAEYVSDLADIVEGIADWKDQRQICILADAPYDPDSIFAAELAVKAGAAVVPCLLKDAQGDMFERGQAVPLLAHVYGTTELRVPIRQRVRQIIVSGLRDPNVPVRQATVEALGKFGTSEWIPALQGVARTGPVSRLLDNGQRRFDEHVRLYG